MRILVTGGAGFIGSTLVDRLLARGDAVTVLDNFDPYYDPRIKYDNLKGADSQMNFGLVEGDIRDKEAVQQLFKRGQFDAVVHLAAQAGVRPSLDDPQYYNSVNIDGTLVVLEAARQHGNPRFVLASTSSVYGLSERLPFREDDPLQHCISPYGITKIACERYGYLYHKLYGLPMVALRFFTAYGPRQRPDMAIHKFTRAILAGNEITLFGDGSTSRDYTYIDDIVSGVIAALDSNIQHGIYNLGNSETVSLIELVRTIERATGVEARLRYEPEQPGDPPHTSADIGRAVRELGFAPQTPIDLGVERFVSWLRGILELEQAAGGRSD